MRLGYTFLAALLFFATPLLISCSSEERVTSQPWEKRDEQEQLDTFLNRLKEKLPKSSAWEIELAGLKKGDATVNIYYTQMPKGIETVQADTRLIAKKILEIFIEDGVKPAEDWASVFVHAAKRETGETGKGLVRLFGKTYYDFNTDRLIWESAKK